MPGPPGSTWQPTIARHGVIDACDDRAELGRGVLAWLVLRLRGALLLSVAYRKSTEAASADSGRTAGGKVAGRT